MQVKGKLAFQWQMCLAGDGKLDVGTLVGKNGTTRLLWTWAKRSVYRTK